VDGVAGARVAGSNQGNGHFQLGIAGARLPAQHGHLLAGDESEVIQCDVLGECQRWRRRVQLRQLQRDAFARGTSGDPGGVERLHQHEYRFGFILVRLWELRVHYRTNLCQCVAEVSVVIHGIDECAPEGGLPRVEARHLQLPEQVVPQGFTRGV